MFDHLYKYRLKMFAREKLELFWIALFPIILGTFFHIAFSNIDNSAHFFHLIPAAVVKETDNPGFEAVLKALSDSSTNSALLDITYTDYDNALKLLEDGKVDGIITIDDNLQLTVAQEGINQTALYNIVTEYMQKQSLNVMPAGSVSSVRTANIVSDKISSTTVYFFSLIGMAALFGGFFGLKCARQIKADISPEGLRKSITPVKKTVMILSDFTAAYTMHLVCLAVLIIYMVFVLKVSFGSEIGYVMLTCAMGSLIGISSGMFIGSIPKLKETVQTSIFLGLSLVSSFLSGLMVAEIKIYFEHHAPFINRLNPATLISDALYSLLIYDTHERFFTNIITMFIYAALLLTASFLMTRRTRYADL